MTKNKKATSRFEEGYACSQAVFSTLAPEMGISEEVAFKIASAFGGGMSRQGEVCGALTGGLLALGLKYGSNVPDDDEAIREASQKLIQGFKETNGSLLCRELLGYHLIIPKELEKARESGVFNTVCPRLVKNATELAEEIIQEKSE